MFQPFVRFQWTKATSCHPNLSGVLNALIRRQVCWYHLMPGQNQLSTFEILLVGGWRSKGQYWTHIGLLHTRGSQREEQLFYEMNAGTNGLSGVTGLCEVHFFRMVRGRVGTLSHYNLTLFHRPIAWRGILVNLSSTSSNELGLDVETGLVESSRKLLHVHL